MNPILIQSATDQRDKSLVSWNHVRSSAVSPMGGEDGPADVAVGGHGCQLPPVVNKEKCYSPDSGQIMPFTVLVRFVFTLAINKQTNKQGV